MTRTEAFGIAFKDGLAEGWVWGVPEAFRDQLDILQDIYWMTWSRGAPPSLSFDVGHIFYNPPEARRMIWTDALKVLRQTVQVTEAQADELTGSGGWVKIELRHFEDGKAVRTEKHDLSQAKFEAFLRTGRLPLERRFSVDPPPRPSRQSALSSTSTIALAPARAGALPTNSPSPSRT